ncbi:MAG: restriction endonuclease subunit S [Planctomycetaceae bacterium]|nr:restriction endonuclease subunit S [Planctomycetaceae bacterium]
MSWEIVPFESLYAEPSRNGIYKAKEFHGSGTKIVNMGEMFGYEFIGNQSMKRLRLTETELAKSSLKDGDLLFGRRSLVESGAGKCSIVVEPNEGVVFESSIIRARLNTEKVNPLFYYYWFKSPVGRAGISAIVTGTNVKGIRGSDLKNVKVAKPDIEEQHIIVDRCKAYDDLIENNHRRIQLLEESARLLYKEWFVQLRFPGHEHVKIVDGVPEGWGFRPISEITVYLNRGMTPKYADDGEFLIINQKCIRNRLLTLDLARRQTKEFNADKAVRRGDILINSTGTGTLGRVAQIWRDLDKTTVDTHVTIVRPSEWDTYLWFGYALMNLESVFEGMGEGATNQKELKRVMVGELKILVPSSLLREQFHELTKDSVEQIQLLSQANKRLAQARDILLPRLMNGTLAV